MSLRHFYIDTINIHQLNSKPLLKSRVIGRLPRSSVGRAGSSEGETANPLLSRVQNLVRATGSDGRGRCAAKRKPSKSTSTTDISWESHLTDSACGSTRQRPARCTRWADGRMWLSEGGQFPTIHHPTTCAQRVFPSLYRTILRGGSTVSKAWRGGRGRRTVQKNSATVQ